MCLFRLQVVALLAAMAAGAPGCGGGSSRPARPGPADDEREEPAEPASLPPVTDDRPSEVRAFDRFMAQSDKLASKERYEDALRECLKALDIQPRSARAQMVCASLACRAKIEGTARELYRGLRDRQAKTMVLQLCLRENVKVK